MNRTQYFNYIEEKVNTLAYRISLKGKLNILDLHNHSENFYLEFINKLYGYQLVNMNTVKQNVEAIDLIDKNNHSSFSDKCKRKDRESITKKLSITVYWI